MNEFMNDTAARFGFYFYTFSFEGRPDTSLHPV